MSDGDITKKESHRNALVRTEAIMSAIMMMRQPLATETEIAKVGSAYQSIRALVYDMLEGTYWQGYTSGEDQPGRGRKQPND